MNGERAALAGQRHVPIATSASSLTRTIRFRITCDDEFYTLGLVGNTSWLGAWDLGNTIPLTRVADERGVPGQEGRVVWMSPPIKAPYMEKTPFQYRIVANGGRSSPNKRPLIWDVHSRHVYAVPDSGIVEGSFLLSQEIQGSVDSQLNTLVDSGWVHRGGSGAYQLRVDAPLLPLSTESSSSVNSLVTLLPEFGVESADDIEIILYEARPEKNVPAKLFACEKYECSPLTALVHHQPVSAMLDYITYVMNAQSLDALEFGIDVVRKSTKEVIAKGFVPVDCLTALEGTISVSLMSLREGFALAGHFKATYLVVTALNHPENTLCSIQRQNWRAGLEQVTLDIGHRGSGASKATGHSVRENTLLSFQKAALNHSDFIEFDVHLTSDNEVVVHHDFEVKIALGSTEIKMALPLIRSDQARSKDFAESMITVNEHQKGGRIKQERMKREATLKRTMTSGEDMYHDIFYKPTHSMSPASPNDFAQELNQMRVFLSDKTFTSLRQAFRMTPSWLGFNIELKYPTDEEKIAMGTNFYSRNFFVDAVLSTVLEEFGQRNVIFSTFDPACAELLRLKQCKFSVFFLTCGGTKIFKDPRMNSVEAALQFARATRLNGVVAEVSSIVENLDAIVENFHESGLYLFTYGDMNNDIDIYSKQKLAGIDAIIMDDIARVSKAMNKTGAQTRASLLSPKFSKNFRSPSSLAELCVNPSVNELQMMDLNRMASTLNIAALSPIENSGLLDGDDLETTGYDIAFPMNG
jgi:glycerophosphodiester phosphodiesterase